MRFVGAIIVGACALAPAPAWAACADRDLVPTSRESTVRATKATICLVNEQRTTRGLKALNVNHKLRRSAGGWASRMDKENFFSHDHAGSTALKRITATGYLDKADKYKIGENIGWGSGTLATAAARVRSWMAGGQHRKNILTGAYREIGVGIAGAPQAGVASGSVYVLNMGVVKK